MKPNHKRLNSAFTLAELMVALAVGSVILAAMIAASISVQKSLNATNDFFSTSMQQIRIIDYLNRDVKRSYMVTASADRVRNGFNPFTGPMVDNQGIERLRYGVSMGADQMGSFRWYVDGVIGKVQ